MRLIKLFVLPLLILSSCTKEELKIVKGNEPPFDFTQSKSTRREFIDKAFIILSGREANLNELNWADSLLLAHQFSSQSREQVVNYITSLPEFLQNEYQQNIINQLNGAVNEQEISDRINTYNLILMNDSLAFFHPIVIYERDRMLLFQQAKSAYFRTVNNSFFDDLNMGSLNFVIAVYQLFYQRNPTQSETQAGVEMVDNLNSVLYSQNGSSKDEFLTIFFNQAAYYEGQIQILFKKLLLRLPTTEEQSFYTQLYLQTQNHRLIIAKISALDEFIQI
jgi:hypothetical protein